MKNKKLLYELAFSALALIAVTIAILDLTGRVSIETNSTLYIVDNSILVVFAVDYFARLYLSTDRKRFVRSNIPDLIAIIPFSAAFKLFRMAKLLRFARLTKISKMTKLVRLFGIGGKFYRTAYRFLRTNGLLYALSFAVMVTLLGAVGISLAEEIPFTDAIWWAFVTATTVGYGDISPATNLGRIIAGILMLVGIGTIGMLTGTVATFFLEERKETSDERPLATLIATATDLTDEEKQEVIAYIQYLKWRKTK